MTPLEENRPVGDGAQDCTTEAIASLNTSGQVIEIPFFQEERPKRPRPLLKALAIVGIVAVVLLLAFGAVGGGFLFLWYAILSLVCFALILGLIALLLFLLGASVVQGIKAIFFKPKPPERHFDEARVCVELQNGSCRQACLAFLGRHCSELPDFLPAVARRGVSGLTIRIAQPEKVTSVKPIDVFFEPVPLRESAAEFNELLKQLESDSPQLAKLTAAEPAAQPAKTQWKRVPFALLALALLCMPIVGIAYWAMTIFGLILDAIRTHRPHPFLLWLIAYSFVLAGYWIWKSELGWRWFAVPGGVLIRRGRWWDSRWRSRFFDRRSSVLGVIHDMYEDQYHVIVADKSSQRSVTMTTAEGYLLLRAWCSPLHSPLSKRPGTEAGI